MKKVIKRLLAFLIGIPLIAALVLLLPWRHQLALNIVVVFFTGIGALEFSAMLKTKGPAPAGTEAFILGILAAAAETAVVSFGCSEQIVPLVLVAGALWVLLRRIFAGTEELGAFAGRLASGFAVMAYPGFFMYWLIKMSGWENAGPLTLVFLMVSIGNDSAAWAAGMLWGKNNRGVVAASPNKSIAGFIGGVAGSMIVSTGAVLIFPRFFITRYVQFSALPQALLPGILLGLLTGIAAMAGDLCESAIKRSAGFKDSGTLMLARGGILDSVDSIAVAAPVFFICFNLLFV